MAARGVTLTRYGEKKVAIPNRGDGWRIIIEATDNEMMPAEIFGFQRVLKNAATALEGDEFYFVCSPEDLALPVDNPNPADARPYFRKSKIDAIVGSRATADELWEAVSTRTQNLIDALNRKDRMKAEETQRFGDPLTSDESMSSISQSLPAESVSATQP
jgi:hypothetical protein